jgi:hypothetical protein
MLNLCDLSRLKGFRFPRSVIGYAVWAYHRFALSLRDVEDLLAARGITVSYETVRDWVARFGVQFAAKVRRDRPRPADKWHLDEVVVPIKGRKHWLEKRAKVGDALRGGISWRCLSAVNSQPRKGYATCRKIPSPPCLIHPDFLRTL